MNSASRSSIMDHASLFAGAAGRPRRRKRHVRKARFLTPFVTIGSKDGKPVRLGKWKTGHRHNNHHK